MLFNRAQRSCSNSTNHYFSFCKNFVKLTLLPKKSLKSWFDEKKICGESKFFIFPQIGTYSRGEKSRWWLKKVLTKSTFIIEEERHKDMYYILYLLVVNKGGFKHSKNGSGFFIHCPSHFLWGFKLLIYFFAKENGQKMTTKILNAYKKWHMQCMRKLNPFLESPIPPLLTA